MQEITDRLIEHIRTVAADADEIELMSYEFGGITGHIDHIVAARAAATAFYRIKEHDDRLTRLRLFCLPNRLQPERNTSWIYHDAGYMDNQIYETVDARHLRERIITVIDTHASQASDGQRVKELLGEELGMNWFQIIE